MANNKKIFTIEINGLAESIKAVDALQEKINALQKTLKEFGKNGIEIPINFGDSIKKFEKSLNKIKQKASKVTLAPTSDDAEYNKLLAERIKKLEAVNRELADTKKNAEEYKQETKDLVAIENKARNEAQGYANTINGLKKELKDLNSMKDNIPIDTDMKLINTTFHGTKSGLKSELYKLVRSEQFAKEKQFSFDLDKLY
mgnify:CR=1 FL=1